MQRISVPIIALAVVVFLAISSACSYPSRSMLQDLRPEIVEAHRNRTGPYGLKDSILRVMEPSPMVTSVRESPLRFTANELAVFRSGMRFYLRGTLIDTRTGKPPDEASVLIVEPIAEAIPLAFSVERVMDPPDPSTGDVEVVDNVNSTTRLAFVIDGEPALLYDIGAIQAEYGNPPR